MIQKVYFNIFFGKIDLGAPRTPQKLKFFYIGNKTKKNDISASQNHILSIESWEGMLVECPGSKKSWLKPKKWPNWAIKWTSNTIY